MIKSCGTVQIRKSVSCLNRTVRTFRESLTVFTESPLMNTQSDAEQSERRIPIMIQFILGALFGGTVGVFAMACCAAAKEEDNDD